jgi:hypothetical protein
MQNGPVDPQAEFVGWMKQYATYQEFFNQADRHFVSSDAKAWLLQNGNQEGAKKLLTWQRQVRRNLRKYWTMALPVGGEGDEEGGEGAGEQAGGPAGEQAGGPPEEGAGVQGGPPAQQQPPPPVAAQPVPPQGGAPPQDRRLQTGPLPVADVQGNVPQIQPRAQPARQPGISGPAAQQAPPEDMAQGPEQEQMQGPPAQGPESIAQPEVNYGEEAYSGMQGNPYEMQDRPRNRRERQVNLEPAGEVGGLRAREESWLKKRREKEALEAELAELETREPEGEEETAKKRKLQKEIEDLEAEAKELEEMEPTEQLEYEEPKRELKKAPEYKEAPEVVVDTSSDTESDVQAKREFSEEEAAPNSEQEGEDPIRWPIERAFRKDSKAEQIKDMMKHKDDKMFDAEFSMMTAGLTKDEPLQMLKAMHDKLGDDAEAQKDFVGLMERVYGQSHPDWAEGLKAHNKAMKGETEAVEQTEEQEVQAEPELVQEAPKLEEQAEEGLRDKWAREHAALVSKAVSPAATHEDLKKMLNDQWFIAGFPEQVKTAWATRKYGREDFEESKTWEGEFKDAKKLLHKATQNLEGQHIRSLIDILKGVVQPKAKNAFENYLRRDESEIEQPLDEEGTEGENLEQPTNQPTNPAEADEAEDLEKLDDKRVPNQPVELAEIEGKGVGLKANQAIGKGTNITWYGGRLVSTEHAEKMRDKGKATHLMTNRAGAVVDGRLQPKRGLDMQSYVKSGQVAQFANEADANSRPNAKYVWYTSADAKNVPAEARQFKGGMGPAISIQATRDIEPGEEITVNYGNDYHRDWEAGEPKPKMPAIREEKDDDYEPAPKAKAELAPASPVKEPKSAPKMPVAVAPQTARKTMVAKAPEPAPKAPEPAPKAPEPAPKAPESAPKTYPAQTSFPEKKTTARPKKSAESYSAPVAIQYEQEYKKLNKGKSAEAQAGLLPRRLREFYKNENLEAIKKEYEWMKEVNQMKPQRVGNDKQALVMGKVTIPNFFGANGEDMRLWYLKELGKVIKNLEEPEEEKPQPKKRVRKPKEPKPKEQKPAQPKDEYVPPPMPDKLYEGDTSELMRATEDPTVTVLQRRLRMEMAELDAAEKSKDPKRKQRAKADLEQTKAELAKALKLM